MLETLKELLTLASREPSVLLTWSGTKSKRILSIWTSVELVTLWMKNLCQFFSPSPQTTPRLRKPLSLYKSTGSLEYPGKTFKERIRMTGKEGITIKSLTEYRCLGLQMNHKCLDLWQLLMLSVICSYYWLRAWGGGWRSLSLGNISAADNIWLNFQILTSLLTFCSQTHVNWSEEETRKGEDK